MDGPLFCIVDLLEGLPREHSFFEMVKDCITQILTLRKFLISLDQ